MNNDDKLDRQLKEELNSVDIPAPSEDARRRAIALAREAFEAGATKEKPEIHHGFRRWWRLMVGSNADNGRQTMIARQKFLYSAVAAACLGAVAVGISLQTSTYRPDLTGRDGLSSEMREQDRTTPVERPIDENKAEGERRADKAQMSRPVRESEALFNAAEPYPASPPPMPAARQALAGQVAMARKESDLADADDMAVTAYYKDVGRDQFEAFEENTVKLVAQEPVSTFSVDVDTASYSFVRRMLNQGVLPQVDAVRAEELINYFDYDYPLPESSTQPFQPTVAVSAAPWAEGRRLLHIGIKGFDITPAEKPRSNLVFLLDVSGSMNSPDKLPLVKQSMELLLTSLNPDDTVAIAVYAGAAGTVLEPTPVKDKQKILNAMNSLSAGGSTAGAQGIRLAYELAQSTFQKNAINRVILATDGDFNVGITNQRELQSFIERKRDEGIFLSVLGFGQGNYQDALMQTLAQNGNGVAAYIDTLSEAQKVLVDEATSTLFPIAKDVKIQVEFNPAMVAEYRLVGYETRHLNREDFNNDAVDAGDIGAGHTVTAIYEITPVDSDARYIDESRYAAQRQPDPAASGEYGYLKIRYKLPDENTSRLITRPITVADTVELVGEGVRVREAGFATAVAGFAQLLKGGRYTGDYSYDQVIELAQRSRGEDRYGYRTEFVQLVRKAKTASAMQAR